jgi:hypothetical protein
LQEPASFEERARYPIQTASQIYDPTTLKKDRFL